MAAMMPAFQTYIDRLHGAAGANELRHAMSGLAASFGLDKFAYLGFPRPSPHKPVLITTYPAEWQVHYFSRRYQDIDPVVAQTRSSLLPFLWNGVQLAERGSGEQRKFFGEAAEFGISCGFAVPIHDSQGGVAVVSFASDRTGAHLGRDIEQRRHILHLASLYFHAHSQQKLDTIVSDNQPRLSPREVACLQWVVRGKSAWEIGEILTVSRRTVIFHLENAKRKLNAVTLPQAVALALQNRIIEF
jgi:LuxR family transcriptional regulator, activator of conjugal transfer of Ti plasmids